MPEQDPLAQLRDIHLPAAISGWPPAPGWWIVAALLIILIAFAVFFVIRKIKKNQYRRLALKQLLQLNFNSDDPNTYLQQLNQLLKQTAMAAHFPEDIAGLSGKQWLNFLDDGVQSTDFCQGTGQILADGPYSNASESFDQPALQQLCQHWIKKHQFQKTNAIKTEAVC